MPMLTRLLATLLALASRAAGLVLSHLLAAKPLAAGARKGPLFRVDVYLAR